MATAGQSGLPEAQIRYHRASALPTSHATGRDALACITGSRDCGLYSSLGLRGLTQHDVPAQLTDDGHVPTRTQDNDKVKGGSGAADIKAPRRSVAATILAAISIVGVGHVALQACTQLHTTLHAYCLWRGSPCTGQQSEHTRPLAHEQSIPVYRVNHTRKSLCVCNRHVDKY